MPVIRAFRAFAIVAVLAPCQCASDDAPWGCPPACKCVPTPPPPPCPICAPNVSVGGQKQYSDPWGPTHLDCAALRYVIVPCPSPTFREAGCLITCLANVTGQTPSAVNIVLGAIVKPTGGLTSLWNAAVRLGFRNAAAIAQTPDEIMTKGLCAGNPVLANVVTAKGHWVAITGQVTGASGTCNDYTISDPGHDKTRLSEYSVIVLYKLVR